MKFDTLLSNHVGDFGRYQQYIFFLTCLPPIWCAVITYMWTFTGMDVEYECTTNPDLNISLPLIPDHLDRRCYRGIQMTNAHDQPVTFDYESCGHGQYAWMVAKGTTSAVQDYELVCDREYLKAIAQSLFYLAVAIGSLTVGNLATRFGRKPVLLVGSISQVFVTCGVVACPNMSTFIVMRMLQGLILPTLWQIPLLAAVEMTGASKRTVTGMLIELAFTAGIVLLGGIAYVVRDWRTLQLIVGLPGLGFLSYYWIYPESPRWLLSVGRREEALVIIRRMAKVNGNPIQEETLGLLNDIDLDDSTDSLNKPPVVTSSDESALNKMSAAAAPSVESYGYLTLFENAGIRRMTLICCFTWPTVTLLYYAISLNPGKIGGDFYGSFILAGLVEVPAIVILIFTLDTIGRRTLLATGFFIGGASLVALVVIPLENTLAISIVINVAKWAVTAAFCIIYLHTSECFCTVLRSNAIGLFVAVSRLGGIISPFANMYFGASALHRNATLSTFGVLAAIAAILTMYLPETTNAALPETLDDGEVFARNVQFSILPRKNGNKQMKTGEA